MKELNEQTVLVEKILVSEPVEVDGQKIQLSNNHTSVGVGHMKEILREAFVIYLGYGWVEIDG